MLRTKLIQSILMLVACVLLTACAGSGRDLPIDTPVGHEFKPPNILWITAEDMSPVLGCYGDKYAITPNIDALAKQSTLYTNAFASAPVCSPSRACLINGLFATTQGAHQMRSAYPLPAYMNGFPALLRKRGYYTTNNVKTDYNSGNAKQIIADSWDESSDKAHWRGRKEGQPFFSVINLMTSHQSRAMVWPYEKFKTEVQSKLSPEEIHDPAKAPLPPYYPDSPIIRRTYARFYDCVTAMDKQVGEILKQLEEDGLADNTIVFFYGDHGNGLPRHKRAMLDSGMRVPLLIRDPWSYKSAEPQRQEDNPGSPARPDRAEAPVAPEVAARAKMARSTTDRLVSFVDFGPTVLSRAAMKIPKHMEGKPFLGYRETEPREYVYGHRDRVDEVIDLARSVRDKRYLYVRNYMPHLGYNQQSAWPDLGEVRHEFYRMTNKETMTPAQWHYAGPTRPVEELFDCQADPLNLKNLAASPDHAEILDRMRKAHRAWVLESRDLGFVPEIEMARLTADTTPYDWARQRGSYDLENILTAAAAVGSDDQAAMMTSLKSKDASVRYWGAMGLGATKKLSPEANKALHAALRDPADAVRIEAASAVARHGQVQLALLTLTPLLKHEDLNVELYAARAIEMMGAKAKSAQPDMQALFDRHKEKPGDSAMFIRFSAEGFLNRLK